MNDETFMLKLMLYMRQYGGKNYFTDICIYLYIKH